MPDALVATNLGARPVVYRSKSEMARVWRAQTHGLPPALTVNWLDVMAAHARRPPLLDIAR
jgi:hypothetical protein